MNKHVHAILMLGGAGMLATSMYYFSAPDSVSAAQQPAAPAGRPAPAAAAGQQLFTANCGFCHGSDARGGAEGGADLTRSQIAISATQLAAFLKVGRPPKMPSFDLPATDIASISAYVNSQVPGVGRNAPVDPNAVLVGDAAAGKAYFEGAGKCTTCHSVTGDLKSIGSKYTPQLLQGRMVLARGSGGYPGGGFGAARANVVDLPRKVEVTPAKGTMVSGELVKISDYVVTLKESSGVLRTFTREGAEPAVKITDPLQAHIDMLPNWAARDMHDVTAYLVTIK